MLMERKVYWLGRQGQYTLNKSPVMALHTFFNHHNPELSSPPPVPVLNPCSGEIASTSRKRHKQRLKL